MVGKTILDRYELQELVGSGGMGAVFKGVQRAMSRQVAIKILPKLDPLTAARFHREAKTASRLSHPNTITIFDFGQTSEGFLFLVMEYLVGRSLKPVIVEGGATPPRRAAHLVGQVCRSLSEAHELGIVHRDIKPDNIFLVHRDDDPDFVKVLDFGIAKVMAGDDCDDDLTQQGRIVGTPRYMAPEQALGLPVDHRADIYSLGVLLYHLLTGTPPFTDSSSAMLMMKHAHEMPESFADRLGPEAASAIPAGLEAVVMKAMSKSPDSRQQTVDILRTELELVMPTVSNSYASMERPAALRPSGAHQMVRPSGQFQPLSGHANPKTPTGDFAQRNAVSVQPDPSGSSPSLSHPAIVSPHPIPAQPSDSWPVVQRIAPRPHPVEEEPEPTTAPMNAAELSGDRSLEWQPRRTGPLLLGLFAILGIVVLLLIGAAGAVAWLELRAPEPAAAVVASDEPEVAEPELEPAAAATTIAIRVTSTPAAAVYAGDTRLGMTPMVVEVERSVGTVEYEVRKEGFQPVARRFDVETAPEKGIDWAVSLEDAAVAQPDPEPTPTVAPTANRPDRDDKRAARIKARKDRRADEAKTDEPKGVALQAPDKAETKPGSDKAAPTSDKPRKPKVTLLDGGGTRKPKVGIVGGGDSGGDDKRKKAKVKALE